MVVANLSKTVSGEIWRGAFSQLKRLYWVWLGMTSADGSWHPEPQGKPREVDLLAADPRPARCPIILLHS